MPFFFLSVRQTFSFYSSEGPAAHYVALAGFKITEICLSLPIHGVLELRALCLAFLPPTFFFCSLYTSA